MFCRGRGQKWFKLSRGQRRPIWCTRSAEYADLKNGLVFQMITEEIGIVGDTGQKQQKRINRMKIIEDAKMTVSGEILRKNKKNTTGQKNLNGEAKVSTKTNSNGLHDEVNHPPHYASGQIECIDAMEAMVDSQQINFKIKLTGHMFYLWQVIFKYLWRFPLKENAITDLKKAEFYLKRLIEGLEKNKL